MAEKALSVLPSVPFCRLTCLASMTESISADAVSWIDVMIPLALWAGRRRHATSTNAMRPKLATRRHNSEGRRVMVG